jgi:hypothetical protein
VVHVAPLSSVPRSARSLVPQALVAVSNTSRYMFVTLRRH